MASKTDALAAYRTPKSSLLWLAVDGFWCASHFAVAYFESQYLFVGPYGRASSELVRALAVPLSSFFLFHHRPVGMLGGLPKVMESGVIGLSLLGALLWKACFVSGLFNLLPMWQATTLTFVNVVVPELYFKFSYVPHIQEIRGVLPAAVLDDQKASSKVDGWAETDLVDPAKDFLNLRKIYRVNWKPWIEKHYVKDLILVLGSLKLGTLPSPLPPPLPLSWLLLRSFVRPLVLTVFLLPWGVLQKAKA
jgi:hypothetical protein